MCCSNATSNTDTPQPSSCPAATSSTTDNQSKKRVRYWQNKYYREKNKAQKKSKRASQVVSKKKKKQQLIDQLSQYLDGPALEFVNSRIHMGKKKRRWSARDKSVALALYHASPKAYRIVKNIFAFPSVATLRRVMKKVHVYPGINENILNYLKQKN